MSDYGDEDFENYDDEDFEAEEEYDVLPKATLRASVVPPPKEPSPEPRSSGGGGRRSSHSGFQPPPSAQQPLDLPRTPALTDAQRVSSRKKLGAALKKIRMGWVKLEMVNIDEIFANAEQSEYDLFSMGRGQFSGKKAGAAQTNDDAKEEECQTDEIESQSYAGQAPEDRNEMTDVEVDASSVAAGVYRGASSPATPAAGSRRSAATVRITQMEAGMELKLAAFVQWAGPMVLAALGIAPNSKKISLKPDPFDGKGLGAGIVPLGYPELLANRPVNSLALSSAAAGDPLVLVAYGPVGAQLGSAELLKDHSLATKGCLCVWDLSSPKAPKAVLVSEGTPSCCGFAPAPASSIVFAGMEEGGLCLWDLEESESQHPSEALPGGGQLCARRPAYTSECSLDMAASGAPIVSVVAVPRGGSRSTPCYLYSLSALGDVSVWTVSVLSRVEAASIDLDLGMRIGSCVRLVRVVANVRLGMAALRHAATGLSGSAVQCSSLQSLPLDPRHFLVAADGGRVLKGSWVGTAPAPKEYVAHDHGAAATLGGTGRARVPTCVTAIHVSPICPWAFLAGHDDGTITLHSVGTSTAAAVWPCVASGGVRALRWSPARPCVFFVMDATCVVSCFDLSKNRSGPVYTQSFMAADPSQAGGACLSTCFEVGAVSQDDDDAQQLPGFAVGYDDGRVDFIAFSDAYVIQNSAEAQVLVDLVGPAPASSRK